MPTIYHASKPRRSNWAWFAFIVIRIVFPPILLWDLIKLGANRLLGEWVSHLVLPAQNAFFNHLALSDDEINDYNRENRDHLLCEKYHIITHDGALLDTLEMSYSPPSEPADQLYIIHLTGNGMCYESSIAEMKEDATTLKATVIGFNFRGVGQSRGKVRSKEDLVTDAIAQVQRLLDKGVSPQNITLKGFSLGAGIATLATLHFHQQKKPIYLFNNRSFSSITNFLVGHIRQLKRNESGWIEPGYQESVGGVILGWLAKPIIKFGVVAVKWEINAGSAFRRIPEAYRDYILLRSRKEIRAHRADDQIIPYYASIHRDLAFERHLKKTNIDKNDRKMEADDPHANAHLASNHELHNRSGKSAQAFFIEFVQKSVSEHTVRYAQFNR